MARTAARVHRLGPRRIQTMLRTMHVEREVIGEVLSEIRDDFDEAALMEEVLDRRLRGGRWTLDNPDDRQRLVRHLVSRGFSPSAAAQLIRNKRRAQ